MKNLLILTYWSYKDPLIQTYTMPYVRIIKDNLPQKSKIYLLTIEQEFFRMSNEEWQKEKEKLQKENIHLIRFRYSKFGLKMGVKFIGIFASLFFLTITKNISKIHTWCTPAGAIGYILSVLTFKPLVIDSFEPHAEAMLESKTWRKESFSFRLLFRMEYLQVKKAETVIACVDKMKTHTQKTYNVDIQKFYSIPACVNTELFKNDSPNRSLVKSLGFESKIVCVYLGKLGGLYLEKEVFDFFKECSHFWGDKFRVLLLTTHTDNELKQYCKESGLDKNIIISKYVNHKDVPKYLGLASFAINPTKPVPSRRYGTPIKTAEYWAMGLPVVITKEISDDSEIIEKEDIGYVLKELNQIEYKNAIVKVDKLLKQEPKTLKDKIRNIAVKYRSFTIAKKVYNEIYG